MPDASAPSVPASAFASGTADAPLPSVPSRALESVRHTRVTTISVGRRCSTASKIRYVSKSPPCASFSTVRAIVAASGTILTVCVTNAVGGAARPTYIRGAVSDAFVVIVPGTTMRVVRCDRSCGTRANPKPLFLSDQYREWLTVVYQDNLSDLRSGGQPRPRGLR